MTDQPTDASLSGRWVDVEIRTEVLNGAERTANPVTVGSASSNAAGALPTVFDGKGKQQRIGALDLLRFLTVSAALVSHVMAHHWMNGALQGGAMLAVKSITRASTPSLLILFGMMIELVYARRFRVDRAQPTRTLLKRCAICYLCYIGLAFVALVFKSITFSHFLGVVILSAHAPYAGIFKLYSVLMLLTIGLLRLKAIGGFASLWLIAGGIWIFHFVIGVHLGPAPSAFQPIYGFLIGAGGTWGPSVLHSLFLVIAGMTLGNALFAKPAAMSVSAAATFLGLASIGLVIYFVYRDGVWSVMTSLSHLKRWRNHNHAGYFAYGIAASFAMIGVCFALTAIMPGALLRIASYLGSRTLAYFFLGNLILIASPRIQITSLPVGLLFCAGYLLAAGLLTWCYATASAAAIVKWKGGRHTAVTSAPWACASSQ